MAKLNPETGLDCVSAGAVRRRPSADADQSAERKDLAGDQTAEQVRHTPGPWSVDAMSMHVSAKDSKGYMRIADIRGWGHLTGNGYGALGLPDVEAAAIQKANAHLIAAAPDMLAALKDCLPLFDHVACGEVEDRIRAAIAKAEGRS